MNGSLLNPDRLLEIWEGHRRLTLRTVEAFPEDKLFAYRPVETLRSFGEMMREILDLEAGYVHGVATGEWIQPELYGALTTRQELLAACRAVREETRRLWPRVTTERLLQVEEDPWFGAGPQANLERILYAIENEIHHRGQAYVYLRELGIEPPAFYER